ncbi:MAG: hypothetical protein AB8G77_18440 [Rhodothermales bacterium]
MKSIKGIVLVLLGVFLIFPADADAQVARVKIQIGGPKVHTFAHKPGYLTVRAVPNVVVVSKRSLRHGHAIVYKDRPDFILSSYHNDFVKVGFTRVSVKKTRRTTTVVYKKGDERVRVVVRPYKKHWEAQIVAV